LRQAYRRESVQRDLASIGVGIPEALLAHQLASQRTAFAIPGPGPVQSDAFPILEYDAPQAFFIGEMATRIARFDERTWQWTLAPNEKISALSKLDDNALRSAFKYETINAELWYAVAPRLQIPANGAVAQPQLTTRVPCVFLPAAKLQYEIPSHAGEVFRNLMAARADLEQNTPGWRDQVQIVYDALKSVPTGTRPESEGSVVRAATAAVRASLSHHDFQLAKELLELGYARDPDEPELGYLQRILEREAAGFSEPVRRSRVEN
jgi:hypothetical protein